MTMRRLALLLFLASMLGACNLVSDYGRTSPGDRKGYLTYINHTLGVTFLVPQGWNNRMDNGGNYNMVPLQGGGDSFSARTSPLRDLFAGDLPENASLDQVHERMLERWYRPSDIGPDFEISSRKSTLSGKPAWEITYAYTPEGMDRRWVKMIFTLDQGRVYMLRWYARKATKDRYAREYNVVRNAYTILN